MIFDSWENKFPESSRRVWACTLGCETIAVGWISGKPKTPLKLFSRFCTGRRHPISALLDAAKFSDMLWIRRLGIGYARDIDWDQLRR